MGGNLSQYVDTFRHMSKLPYLAAIATGQNPSTGGEKVQRYFIKALFTRLIMNQIETHQLLSNEGSASGGNGLCFGCSLFSAQLIVYNCEKHHSAYMDLYMDE